MQHLKIKLHYFFRYFLAVCIFLKNVHYFVYLAGVPPTNHVTFITALQEKLQRNALARHYQMILDEKKVFISRAYIDIASLRVLYCPFNFYSQTDFYYTDFYSQCNYTD